MASFVPANISNDNSNVGRVPLARRLRTTLEVCKAEFHKAKSGADMIHLTWEITGPDSANFKDEETGELQSYALVGQKVESYHGWEGKSASIFLQFLNQMQLDPSNAIDTENQDTLEPFKNLAVQAYLSSSRQARQEHNPVTGEMEDQVDPVTGKKVLGNARWNMLNSGDIIQRVPRSKPFGA